MIHALRMRLHRRHLQEAIGNTLPFRQPLSLEDAHVIGILFNATHLDRRRAAEAFSERLQTMGKVVFRLGYFENRQDDPNFTFKHFNKKQIDWLFRPSSREVDSFLGRSFDMLINLEPRSQPHTEYLAAACRAKFKVGPRASSLDIYDLMVEARPGQDEAAFVDQVASLLEKTNPRHEESNL